MKHRLSTGIAFTIALLAICIALPAPTPAAVTEAGARQPAPDFSLSDSAGTPIHLSAYKGKVVLLDFWATWCTGCKIEIPWYVEFQDKYKSSGLSAIGVSMDDDGWKSVKPWLAEHKLNYPIVIGSPDMAKLYGGIPSMPVTLLIDRNGKVADWHVGMVDKGAFEGEIQTLLHEKVNNAAK